MRMPRDELEWSVAIVLSNVVPPGATSSSRRSSKTDAGLRASLAQERRTTILEGYARSVVDYAFASAKAVAPGLGMQVAQPRAAHARCEDPAGRRSADSLCHSQWSRSA